MSCRISLFVREMPPMFQYLTIAHHLSNDHSKYQISRRCHRLIHIISWRKGNWVSFSGQLTEATIKRRKCLCSFLFMSHPGRRSLHIHSPQQDLVPNAIKQPNRSTAALSLRVN